MKKITALFLALIMLCSVFSLPATAVAKEKHEKCPVIFIAGSSVDICDAEGNEISTGFDVLTDDDEGDYSKEQVIEKVANILLPFVMEGLPRDKWDNYGDALYEELAPIWDETQLDCNGNAKYGTGVSKSEIAYWDNVAATQDKGADGYFGVRDYDFRYDWRLSPYDLADRLHAYIKEIRETTGCDQVALTGRCLGGNIITAYLEKYGSYGYVKKIFFDEVLVNGSGTINDCFSGKIDFSDKHAQAYLVQAEYFGKNDVGYDLSGMNVMLLEVADRTLDLMTQLGVMDTLLMDVKELYDRLYTALMPSLLLATGIGTWLGYWTTLYSEDVDTAINLIFGKEGSERRTEYAGLINKIEYIREHIIDVRPELFKKIADEYGVEVGALVSYGLANAPIVEHHDELGDAVVGVQDASLGATTAGLFTTLSDEYVNERVALGYGDYISLDKKIDASTCLFPETTWFIKNKHHDFYAAFVLMAEYFTQYSNVTASSNNKNLSRFLVQGEKDHRDYITNMTEENMGDGMWLETVEQKPTISTKLASLIRFFTTILNFFRMLFEGSLKLEF